jgi:2-iminobutanoate/2-iminopropanoate deaminase
MEVFMEIEIISSPKAPRAVGPYCQATKAGPFVFCSGQAGFDPSSGKIVEGGIREQTAQTLRNLETILQAAGSSLSRVVKTTVFLHDWKYFKEMNEVFAEFFKENPPARSTIQGARWPEGCLVAMEAIAIADNA